jgi:hypothetical protein
VFGIETEKLANLRARSTREDFRSQSDKSENNSNTSASESVKQGKASFCKPAAPWLKVLGRCSQHQGRKMKKSILTLACALIAPLAFAQTSTTTVEKTKTNPVTGTTTTETTTTYSSGSVTTYTPGKTIIVKSDEGPVEFALNAPLRVVNAAGNVVKTAITPGQKVKVYYTGNGNTRVVERVVVDED